MLIDYVLAQIHEGEETKSETETTVQQYAVSVSAQWSCGMQKVTLKHLERTAAGFWDGKQKDGVLINKHGHLTSIDHYSHHTLSVTDGTAPQ